MGTTAQRGWPSSSEDASHCGLSLPSDGACIAEAVRWLVASTAEGAKSGGGDRVLITAFGGNPHAHALAIAREIATTARERAGGQGTVLQAQSGVILVDTSQGAAALSALMRVARSPGLAELCQYRARFEDVIQRDEASRLHFLAPGKPRTVGGAWGEPGVADRVFRALDASYRYVVFCAEAAEGLQLAENLKRQFSAAIIADFTDGREERLAAILDSFGFPTFTIR